MLAGFFGAHVGDMLVEDVHLAEGVVVTKAVERDLDVDGGDVEVLERRAYRTRTARLGRRGHRCCAWCERPQRRADHHQQRHTGASQPPRANDDVSSAGRGSRDEHGDEQVACKRHQAVAQDVDYRRQLVPVMLRRE